MNVPNLLTLLRIFFVPMLVAALVQESVQFRVGDFVFTNDYLALAVFSLLRRPICWTDFSRDVGNRSPRSGRCSIRLPTSCSSLPR